MKMKIKTKLYLGLGFLALLIVLLWGSGLIFINLLTENSNAIISDNRSVTYIEHMQQTLKELYLHQSAMLLGLEDAAYIHQTEQETDSLKKNLLRELGKEQHNITEIGEVGLTGRLQKAVLNYFNQFGQIRNQSTANIESYRSMTRQYGEIQELMGEIAFLNLAGTYQKNENAQQKAANLILYMVIIGAISTLLAIGLLIKFPNYIVNPIQELIARIKSIANQNYDQRLEFETGDEYEELAKAFNTMASHLREYDSSNIARLKDEKQRIETIINHMNDAVIGLDKNKNILFINTKAMELIGLKREKLIDRYAPDIASTNDLMRKLIQDLMNGKEQSKPKGEKPDILKIVSNHKQVYYVKEAIPVISADTNREKQRTGSIITLKNVTRFQEMDEAKTNFVAVVSHELKTPIASIDMSARLLHDERVGQLNEEQDNLVTSIQNDTRRMRRTTSELLDLSKIETGNIQLNIQQADPSNLIAYAYETMASQAHQKNVTIETECDEKLQPLKADLQKTVWTLVNLISNAIRYTSPKGFVKLKAEEMPQAVKFSVTDTGKGIPSKYLDKIFNKYFQVYEGQNKNEGTGLGLAISKEFINAQGGEIGVESELGKGSTFYFTLPKDQES
jgi:PAS domain S-box-containing protein